MSERILELQAVDTATTQLNHRRSHLPEIDALRAARADLESWQRRRAAAEARIAELTSEIEAAERSSHEIDDHIARLEKQLRTVISPREAEALQHEIATLRERRSALDDRELEALEEQAQVDDTRAELADSEAGVRAAVSKAEEALAVAQADIDQQLAELDTTRAELRPLFDASLLDRYDRLRAQLGVAVARLDGRRCDGCHLDLSAVELDAVRHTPEGELADCPQCSRLLVR